MSYIRSVHNRQIPFPVPNAVVDLLKSTANFFNMSAESFCAELCPTDRGFNREAIVCDCANEAFRREYNLVMAEHLGSGLIMVAGAIAIAAISFIAYKRFKPLQNIPRLGQSPALLAARRQLEAARETSDPSRIERAKSNLRTLEQPAKVAELRKRILAGNDPDSRLPQTEITALHQAAGKGWDLVATELLLANATIDLTDGKGQTALHRACLKGQLDMAKLLVEKGASTSARDREGNTPLMLLMQSGFKGEIDFLINNDDLNHPNKAGDTALHLAAAAASPNWIKAVLAAGADPASLDGRGRNALERLLGNQFPAKTLFEKYFANRLDHEKGKGSQEIREAFNQLNPGVRSVGERLVKEVARKVSPNGAKEALAAAKQDPYFLLERNSHFHSEEKKRVSVVGVALLRAEKNLEILRQFDLPFDRVAQSVKLLMERIDPNQMNRDGIPLLHTALRSANTDFRITELLLASKKIDLKTAVDRNGNTAAHVAAEVGAKEVLEKLIKGGLNPSRLNHEGILPLQRALENGDEGCIRLLARHMDRVALQEISIRGLSLIEYALVYAPPGLSDALYEKGIYFLLGPGNFPRLEKAMMRVVLEDLKIFKVVSGASITEFNQLTSEIEQFCSRDGDLIAQPSLLFEQVRLGIKHDLEQAALIGAAQQKGTHGRASELVPLPFGDYLNLRRKIGELFSINFTKGALTRVQKSRCSHMKDFLKVEQKLSSCGLFLKGTAKSTPLPPSHLRERVGMDYYELYPQNKTVFSTHWG